jgi:hypothetical protein
MNSNVGTDVDAVLSAISRNLTALVTEKFLCVSSFSVSEYQAVKHLQKAPAEQVAQLRRSTLTPNS